MMSSPLNDYIDTSSFEAQTAMTVTYDLGCAPTARNGFLFGYTSGGTAVTQITIPSKA